MKMSSVRCIFRLSSGKFSTSALYKGSEAEKIVTLDPLSYMLNNDLQFFLNISCTIHNESSCYRSERALIMHIRVDWELVCSYEYANVKYYCFRIQIEVVFYPRRIWTSTAKLIWV